MNISELKTKSETELRHLLDELRKTLRNLKFDLSAGKIKNVRLTRKTKKEIAQILTFLNQKKNVGQS